MDQLEFQRELAAFDSKIFLGKLETVKAEERVKELEYQKSMFQLDYISAVIKSREQQQQEQAKNAGGPAKP